MAIFKFVLTDRRPCELRRGEMRRVPQNKSSGIVGYHVCCPCCGYVTIALDGIREQSIRESADLRVVTFSRPLHCTYCAVLIHLKECGATLEEDECVRRIEYK